MRHSGFSLLELLIAIGITSMLSLVAVRIASTITDSYTRALHESSRNVRILRAEIILADAMRDNDSFPAASGIRLHRGGRVMTSSGEIAPAFGATSLRPAPGSDALTSASFAPIHSLQVRSSALRGRRLQATICPRWGAFEVDPPYRSVLGIGTQGIHELVLDRPLGSLDRCSTMHLRSTPSLLTREAASSELTDIRTLVPIRHIHTFYLDRRGELRMLSMAGERSIENQPLIDGLKRLSLRLTPHARYRLAGLFATIGTNRAEVKESRYLHRLERRSHYNFLLNRP